MYIYIVMMVCVCMNMCINHHIDMIMYVIDEHMISVVIMIVYMLMCDVIVLCDMTNACCVCMTS